MKFLILRGYRFSIEEFATIFNASRHGNPYRFSMFESGEYIPSERDIEKVQGAIKFQEKYGKTKLWGVCQEYVTGKKEVRHDSNKCI